MGDRLANGKPLGAVIRNLLVAMGALGALAAASPVAAADMVLKAPPPVAYSWTGFYAGGNIGYSWGNADSNYNEPFFGLLGLPVPISTSQSLDGVIGGGQVGYNWQANKTWVLGLEADLQGSGERGSSSTGDPYLNTFNAVTLDPTLTLTNKADIQWFGTVRGRVGVLATPTMLLYASGGLAYGGICASGSVNDGAVPGTTWSFSNSTTKVGWTLGAGIEGAIPNTSNWTWNLNTSTSTSEPSVGTVSTPSYCSEATLTAGARGSPTISYASALITGSTKAKGQSSFLVVSLAAERRPGSSST